MPEYKFRNKDTNKTFIMNMTISERTEYLQNNANIEQLVHGAPGIISGTGQLKNDESYRDLIREINKKQPPKYKIPVH